MLNFILGFRFELNDSSSSGPGTPKNQITVGTHEKRAKTKRARNAKMEIQMRIAHDSLSSALIGITGAVTMPIQPLLNRVNPFGVYY